MYFLVLFNQPENKSLLKRSNSRHHIGAKEFIEINCLPAKERIE